MREDVVTLPDGRRIGYAEYGVADGIPLLEFPGLPGSRFYRLNDQALESAGVRLLTLERPGVGLSDPSPGRTLLDWPRDVGAVADALGLERFGVFGVSFGGPSAIACGYALPDRVGVVGLVCAVGPVFDNPQFDELMAPEVGALLPIARQDRDVALALVRDFLKPTVDAVVSDVGAYFDGEFLAGWHEADRPRFIDERAEWIATLQASYGRGVDAVVEDIAATYGPWDFGLADVHVPVRAWHGEIDPVPIDVIRFVVDSVADGALTEYPGEAHLLSEAHHGDWLAALTEWAH
jgi:pimeloyl-ACP methyl ester carboxylesterase